MLRVLKVLRVLRVLVLKVLELLKVHVLKVRVRAIASRLRSITTSSSPPTISSVGAVTRGSASSAKSGLPPRETTALTVFGRLAAAISAAAAPVLAPNRPIGSDEV